MTEKLNDTVSTFENTPDGHENHVQSENPLDELAKIIGYKDEADASNASANDAATDLEAELLREFGVEPTLEPVVASIEPQADFEQFESQPEVHHEIQEEAPVGQPVYAESATLEPVNLEPVNLAPEFAEQVDMPVETVSHASDDVFDEIARYDLPNHTPAAPPELPAEPVAVHHESAPIDASMIEDAFEVPARKIEPHVQSDFQTDQLIEPVVDNIAETSAGLTDAFDNGVSDIPNPLSTSMPDIEEFDLGDLENDLELELAKLQNDEFASEQNNMLNDDVHAIQSNVADDPKLSAFEPTFEHNSEAAYAPSVENPFAQDANAYASGISQDNIHSIQDLPQPELQAPELDTVMDVADFADTDTDLEETAPFDIPAMPVQNFEAHDARAEPDLDIELEREFSQLLSDDVIDDPLPDNQDVAPEYASAASSFGLGMDDGSGPKDPVISESDELNAMFDLGVADTSNSNHSPSGEVAAYRPERIDVTNDSDVASDPMIAAAATKASSSNVMGVVGVLAVLLLGGGAYLYFQNSDSGFGNSGEPLVISADKTPIKEKPADPGGASVPNQDQAVYEQVEGNDVSIASQSALVESTEEPVDIVQNTLDPSVLPLEGREVGGVDKGDERLSANLGNDTARSQDAAQPLVTPRKVRTVIVQSDGTIVTREVEAAPEVPATTEIAGIVPSVTPSVVPSAEAAVTPNVTPTVTTPVPAVTPEVVAPIAEIVQPLTPVVVAPTVTETASNSNFSGYYMQIASQPSLSAAQSSYASAARRFNSLIGDKGVEYQEAAIAGRGTFHRVRIQVGTRGEANSLCSRFKSAGGSCFVTK